MINTNMRTKINKVNAKINLFRIMYIEFLFLI